MSLEIHLYSVTILSRVPGAHQFLCFATAQSNISNTSYFHSNWTTHTVQNTRLAHAPDLRIFFICPFVFGKAVCLIFTLREPDILECEVKWALESITTNKASWGDGIPVELFQILKDDAVKVYGYASKFGKLSIGHRTGKDQFSFQSQRKVMPKNVQTTARLQSYHTLWK